MRMKITNDADSVREGTINEQYKQTEVWNKVSGLDDHRSHAPDIRLHVYHRAHVTVPEVTDCNKRIPNKMPGNAGHFNAYMSVL